MIKGYTILEHIKEKTDIDLVVTYVDSSDLEWQKLYNKHSKFTVRVDSNGKQRFRSSDNFKFWFRGVEKYLPWINNVFLVVQSMSQVPSWIKKQKVKIVLHEDFIPSKFLPVFNSQAIEMFLHLIPELGEKFIYSNDDVYFMGNLNPDNFFYKGKVKTSFNFLTYGDGKDIPLWKKAALKSHELVDKDEHLKLVKSGKYITPFHGSRPYLKSKMQEVYYQNEGVILKSVTKFRDARNFNVYFYDLYLRKLDLTLNKEYTFMYFNSNTSIGLIKNCFINSHLVKMACLNDSSEEIDELREKQIYELFKSKFGLKSIYEV
jgi:hypothetical protein